MPGGNYLVLPSGGNGKALRKKNYNLHLRTVIIVCLLLWCIQTKSIGSFELFRLFSFYAVKLSDFQNASRY